MEAPFNRVLVPLDGSKLAETVLPFIFMLARRCHAQVTLLHVLEHDAPASVHGEPHLTSMAEAASYLQRLGSDSESAGISWEAHVHENPERDVARSIAEHAVELQADLVALTTHGSGGLRGFLFGRTAQLVVQQMPTTVPVLLRHPVSDPLDEPSLQTILVPLDGVTDPGTMLRFGARLAHHADSQLHLCRVVPTRGTVAGGRGAAATFAPTAMNALLEIEAEAAQVDLERIRAALPEQERVTITVGRGEIVNELLREATAVQADLILANTHARVGLESFLTGSVGAALLERFRHPLVLFRVE